MASGQQGGGIGEAVSAVSWNELKPGETMPAQLPLLPSRRLSAPRKG